MQVLLDARDMSVSMAKLHQCLEQVRQQQFSELWLDAGDVWPLKADDLLLSLGKILD